MGVSGPIRHDVSGRFEISQEREAAYGQKADDHHESSDFVLYILSHILFGAMVIVLHNAPENGERFGILRVSTSCWVHSDVGTFLSIGPGAH